MAGAHIILRVPPQPNQLAGRLNQALGSQVAGADDESTIPK